MTFSSKAVTDSVAVIWYLRDQEANSVETNMKIVDMCLFLDQRYVIAITIILVLVTAECFVKISSLVHGLCICLCLLAGM